MSDRRALDGVHGGHSKMSAIMACLALIATFIFLSWTESSSSPSPPSPSSAPASELSLSEVGADGIILRVVPLSEWMAAPSSPLRAESGSSSGSSSNGSHTHVLIEVASPSAPKDGRDQIRAPLHLSIVLDISGSMMGSKLREAKLAIEQVFLQLHEGDLLDFITYSDGARIEASHVRIQDATRAELKRKLLRVTVEGGTNLYSGLEQAYSVFEKHETSGHLRKVFLFSDGLVNIGRTNSGEIFELARRCKEHGISVNTFGIGSDFDLAIMSGIAENGGGYYQFIASAEAIQSLVRKGLTNAQSIHTTMNQVKLTAAGGATIGKIYGYDSTSEISLGDLLFNDSRRVLLRLDWPAASAGSAGWSSQAGLDLEREFDLEVLQVDLKYTTKKGASSSLHHTTKLRATSDSAKLKEHINKEVEELILLKKLEMETEEVTRRIQAGDLDGAREHAEYVRASGEYLTTLSMSDSNSRYAKAFSKRAATNSEYLHDASKSQHDQMANSFSIMYQGSYSSSVDDTYDIEN